ncbi:SsgA family sporulation/cell division regulator [Streptacidiphilus monticola]
MATGNSGALWRFARDLLRDGLYLPAGEGDVRVWPTSRGTVVELRGVEGTTRLRALLALAEFVHATGQLVPFGTESQAFEVDWDTAVRSLQRHQP